MKNKIFFIVILIFISFSSQIFSQEKHKIKWYDIEEATKLNENNPKKFFIDLFTDWCGWCKKMDANTFSDPVIAKYMNENFWPVKFNAERKDTIYVNDKMWVSTNPGAKRASHQFAVALLSGKMSYPSFAFLDNKLRLITILPGYNPPEKIEPVLHFIAEEAYKEKRFEQYLKDFKLR